MTGLSDLSCLLIPGPGQQQEASSRRKTGKGPRARGSSRASITEARPRGERGSSLTLQARAPGLVGAREGDIRE